MQTNTVQTLIDYVKDISGQTNASTAKIIRALNFGTDHLSTLKLIAGGRFNYDSSNQTDVSRVTVTTSDNTLLLEDEMVTLQGLEIYLNGQYKKLEPIDFRDSDYETLQNQTGTPTSYDLSGQRIIPLPVPDASYTYRLTYGRVHPRYSEDNLTSDTGLLPTEEEYVALYAADKIMLGTSDSARVQVRNELTVKAKEVKKMASLRDQNTPRKLKTSVGAFTKNSFN